MPGLHICRPAGQPFACICPLHTDDAVILIDWSRFQDTDAACFRVRADDGVLITHGYYDRSGRIGRFAPFLPFLGNTCLFGCLQPLICRHGCLIAVDRKYPGVPRIYLQEVEAGRPFYVRKRKTPVTVMHGQLPILGYHHRRSGWGM